MATEGENRAGRWHVSQSIKLLRLYGAHSCLWNVHDIDYRNKKLRCAAWTDIAAAMGNNMTKPVALQKVNILRATYRYEKKRIKHRIRKGIGAKTKLKWFALADTFLRKLPKCNRNAKINQNDSDTDLEDAMIITIDPEAFIPEVEVTTEDDENYSFDFQGPEASYTEEFSDDAVTQIKDEIKYEYSNENEQKTVGDLNKCETKKWTSVESVQFVSLLLAVPHLLKSDTNGETSEHLKDIKKIADAMNISVKRIKARLLILKNTIRTEQKKMMENMAYKPVYVWWSVIEKCLSYLNAEESDACIMPPQFVEVTKVPCNDMTNCNDEDIKASVSNCDKILQSQLTSALVEANEMLGVQTAINNCIALDQSSVNIDKTVDSNIVKNTDTIKEAIVLHGTENNSTKLVYNGLEEDLLEGKWSLKHSVKFLRLYGAHPILWNLSHPDYRVRELRNAAMEDIAAAMGYGLTAQYVAKKIKIFRITYMQHRKRMLEDVKKGKGPDLQLRWFPLADSFLRTHIGLRSIKEQDAEAPQFDFDYVYTNLNLIDPELLSDINCSYMQ